MLTYIKLVKLILKFDSVSLYHKKILKKDVDFFFNLTLKWREKMEVH